MKKLTALLLALLMVFAIIGCTKPETPENPDNPQPVAEPTAKPEEPAPENPEPVEEPEQEAELVQQSEMDVMLLASKTYDKEATGEGDYIDLYNYVTKVLGKKITLDDINEYPEEGYATIILDGKEYILGLDFLTMAMVYNNEPTATYPTADDTYAAWWRLYITRWNALMPEVPLYSNEYYDFYNSKIKGVEEYPTNPYWSPVNALIDWSSEKEDNDIILGDTTELTGHFRVPAFGKSSPAASDNDIASLVTGLDTVTSTKDGGYVWNDIVVAEHTQEYDADGNEVFTIKIKDDLKFSDGSKITAKDYIAATLASLTPVYTEAASRETSGLTVLGWKGAYQKYTGPDSEEGVKYLAGIHLIDEYTFSYTVNADYVPYFYDITYAAFSAQPMAAFLGEGVDIFDDGEGCYLSDEFYAKNEEGKYVQAIAINKLCLDTSAENYAAYPWSGPYVVKSFDSVDNTAVLELNPNFKGNYEGTTPKIQKVIYRKYVEETVLEDFKAGGIDVVKALSTGAEIDNAMKLTEDGSVKYSHYSRAGYGKLGFRADYGPTQFASVRRAVAYCMDRAQFAKDFTGGYGSVVEGPYYQNSWMYKEAVKQGMLLDTYATSADSAIEVLEEDGWVLNADGTPYDAEKGGIRYKAIPADVASENDKNYQSSDGKYKTVEVDGNYLMPLVINWFGSTPNDVSDLLMTAFKENDLIPKIGMYVTSTLGTFPALLDELYQAPIYGYYAGSPMYNAFNFGTGFSSAIYDFSFNMTINPEMYEDYTQYFIKDYADIYWYNK